MSLALLESNEGKFVQPLNISVEVAEVTPATVKLLVTLIFSRVLHPANMLAVLVSAAVLKFLRSSLSTFAQFSNMEAIVVTFCVLNVETSSAVSAEHPLKRLLMSVTFSVENFDRSTLVRAAHPSNMLLMSVAPEVLRFSMPSISVSALMPYSNPDNVVGFTSLNSSLKTTLVIFFTFSSSLVIHVLSSFLVGRSYLAV